MKKNDRLYNIFFPIWVLIFFPTAWLVALPVNFIVDSAVVLIMLALFGREKERRAAEQGQTLADAPSLWKQWIKCIFPVWGFGFLSDLIGGGFMLCWGYLPGILADSSPFGNWWNDRIADPISENPFTSFPALLFAILAVAVSGACIYFLNNRFSFGRTDLSYAERRRLALTLAIATAPYFMLIPSTLLWR